MRGGGVRSRDPAALQGRRAGFVSRVLAAVIDLALLWLLGLAIVLLVSVVKFVVLGPPFVVANPPPVALTPASFAAGVLYLTYFWATVGRTPGQHVFGLRVVDRGGRPVGAIRAVLRAAFCLVFPLGLLWVVVSRRNASVQDLVVRSAVVYDWAQSARER
ncbi:MAG TPA: RDD family protein [Candidatus Binatia bacterium]|nr:RDD family protein [Candidatus Binatia bacterium]